METEYRNRRHRRRHSTPPVATPLTTSWGWLLVLCTALGVFGWYCLYLGRGVTLDYDQIDLVAHQTAKAAIQKVELPGTSTPLFIPTLSLFDQGQPWMYVASGRPLPRQFVPSDLVSTQLPAGAADTPMQLTRRTAEQLKKLFAKAEQDGNPLMISSAYRSIADQQRLYDEFVAKKGATVAAQYVAQPASSEHHTGLAVDVTDSSPACTKDTDKCNLSPATAGWLADNAPRYGFIVRYPSGKQPTTGVAYEPWHLRYVGVVLARQLTDASLTLDEFVEQVAPGQLRRQ